jgi:hypothetical protein
MSTMKLPLGGEYCTPITDHAGMSVGDRITFLTALHDPRRDVRITGTIRAIYVEKHPSWVGREPEGRVFAEVDLDGGGEERCWFWRDKPLPASDVDGVLGAAPEGAMF